MYGSFRISGLEDEISICNAFKLALNIQNVTFETSPLSLQSVEKFIGSLTSVRVRTVIAQSSMCKSSPHHERIRSDGTDLCRRRREGIRMCVP
jgi:hypothetical protein